MEYLLPQGIGDSLWCLMKIQDIAARNAPGEPIRVRLQCLNVKDECERRALAFVERFPFVAEVGLWQGDIVGVPKTTPGGFYNYIPDGPGNGLPEGLCALMPNATLERGERLETWLPGYAIDWTVPERFHFRDSERAFAAGLAAEVGDYAVFYPGPLSGNSHAGHNRASPHAGDRGFYWSPDDWRQLGEFVQGRGLAVVAVGASYDRSFYDSILRWKCRGWKDSIGRWELGQTLAVLKGARLVVAYQSGLAILAALWGRPTVSWWRPQHDSISPYFHVSFDERMATAWVSPQVLEAGTYMGLIYGRESCAEIAERMIEKGWL